MDKFIKKAAVLFETMKPLVIVEDIPCFALGEGQVFVEVVFSGLCRSQLMEARGFRGEDKYLPHMLGHEGTGIVLAQGSKVTKVKPGDKVIMGWICGTGIEAGGVKYEKDGVMINAGPVSTFSTHAVVSENRVCRLPEGVPMDIGVLFGCAVPTGCGILMNEIRPAEGSTIAIFGLGGIGMSALMSAMLYKCKKVIAVDIGKEKLELAREFGATDTVDASLSDPVEIVREISGGGVDYSIDAAGTARTIEQAFASVRKKGGLCVFASHPAKGEKIALDPHDLISGKQIRGSWGGASNPDTDIPLFAELYLSGRLPLEKLLDARYNLENINQALGDLELCRITRALIEIKKDIAK